MANRDSGFSPCTKHHFMAQVELEMLLWAEDPDWDSLRPILSAKDTGACACCLQLLQWAAS